MSFRVSVVLLLLAASPIAIAKNKKKQVLPDVVLRAERVYVVEAADAGEPINDPTANVTAVENVEKALTRWGRFQLVMEPSTADLLISVRKGMGGGMVIRNAPQDNRPVVLQRDPSDIRIGGRTGPPGDASDPTGNDGRPRMANQIGTSEDSFEVHLGTLDSPPLWRYVSKNGLSGPAVPAVEQFRKVFEESEKQSQQKP